ncbi:MAG: diadenylate cyclase CdaA [Candidatus Delongbacteria bacterium]|mgnify:CR=1 FL=1|nr:diadenylate cyclase CdaA [Candidatus Delongbacteria bacterium]
MKAFGFLSFGIWDILDIMLVSYILYKLMLLIRDMKAIPLFMGLIIVVFASFAATWLQLSALMWIIETVKTIWVVAFLIIFQPELRRALSKMGQSSWFQFINRNEGIRTVEIVSAAAKNLSRKGLGAIIVILREASLDSIIETGTPMNSILSEALIETVFTPPSPLHDGALLIQRDTLIAAGCILPITQNNNLDKRLGLRHRAALGISEESDAVVVIVSEETRQISAAFDGRLIQNLSYDDLKRELRERLFTRDSKKESLQPNTGVAS